VTHAIGQAEVMSTSSDHLGGRGDECEMLNGFLDWYRAVVVRKVEGLSFADATRVMTPTGLSPIGIVAHLASAEVGWFDETFAGRPIDAKWDVYGDFLLQAGDTVESVVAEYRRVNARSREVASGAASLDDLSARAHGVWGHVSLRWVLVHMIEETARHAGHLDIMREAIDGRTGD
jgi:hypothetical protein